MKIIITKPGNGKTKTLIKLSAEKWYTIVCFSHKEVDRVKKRAREMELDIPFPISFNEFIDDRFHSPGIRGFLVDNADTLITRMARGVPVEAITLTNRSVTQ